MPDKRYATTLPEVPAMPPTAAELEKRARERKHSIVASIVVLGCVFLLPVSGVIYFVLMKLGWIAPPPGYTP